MGERLRRIVGDGGNTGHVVRGLKTGGLEGDTAETQRGLRAGTPEGHLHTSHPHPKGVFTPHASTSGCDCPEFVSVSRVANAANRAKTILRRSRFPAEGHTGQSKASVESGRSGGARRAGGVCGEAWLGCGVRAEDRMAGGQPARHPRGSLCHCSLTTRTHGAETQHVFGGTGWVEGSQRSATGAPQGASLQLRFHQTCTRAHVHARAPTT